MAGVAVYWLRAARPLKFTLAWQLIVGGLIALALARIGGHFYYDTRPFVRDHVKPLFPHAPDNGFPSDHALLTSFLAYSFWRYSKPFALALFVNALLVSAAMLADTPLVSREPGSGTREVLVRALAHVDLAPRVAVEFASTTAIKAAVSARLGPAVLSRLAVEAELTDRRLVAVPVEGLNLTRSIRAVWRAHSELSPLARTLLGAIAGH